MARFGSLGQQYFDNAGDPLISGKIYFKESGTDTDKDTYADVSLTIKNTNPVILTGAGRQPNIFFNGTAKAVLTDANDVQIEVRDPVGGIIEGSFGSWDSITIYNNTDIVVGSNDLFYISITSGNQGNNPTTDTVNWSEIRFIRIWNVNETYSINRVVEGSDGLLYTSLTDSNIGNDPITDAVNWRSSAPLLREKILEIGDWDMDATSGVSIAHGLTYANIQSFSAIIRNDADNQRYQLPYEGGPNENITVNSVNVNLSRLTAGFFDSTSFDTASYNRGWITIWYV